MSILQIGDLLNLKPDENATARVEVRLEGRLRAFADFHFGMSGEEVQKKWLHLAEAMPLLPDGTITISDTTPLQFIPNGTGVKK